MANDRTEYQKKYYEQNKERLKEKHKEYNKTYYQNNPRDYAKEREKEKATQKRYTVVIPQYMATALDEKLKKETKTYSEIAKKAIEKYLKK